MIGYKEDGRPNNVFLSAKTEKALRDKIVEVKMKMKNGEMIKQTDTLLRDYADSWLATYKSSAGINTKAMYDNTIEKHIKPELGHLPLNKIVRSDIQQVINDRQEHPRTCEIIRMTMVQILNAAIEDRLLHENVAKKTVLPKRHKSEKRALTELEKGSNQKSRLCHAGKRICDAALLLRPETRRSAGSDKIGHRSQEDSDRSYSRYLSSDVSTNSEMISSASLHPMAK